MGELMEQYIAGDLEPETPAIRQRQRAVGAVWTHANELAKAWTLAHEPEPEYRLARVERIAAHATALADALRLARACQVPEERVQATLMQASERRYLVPA